MDEKTFSQTLRLQNNSMLSGKYDKQVTIGDEHLPWDMPIIRAFLDDNDITEMTIVSTNIGFIKTLTKQFRRDES